jgi:hypothetical protein
MDRIGAGDSEQITGWRPVKTKSARKSLASLSEEFTISPPDFGDTLKAKISPVVASLNGSPRTADPEPHIASIALLRQTTEKDLQ